MRESIKNYIKYLKEKRKKQKVVRILCMVCAVLAVCAVMWGFRTMGIALTEKTFSAGTADIETPEEWIRTFEDITYAEDWGTNIAAIAKTQVGYQESNENFTIEENGEWNGYTRYGAWSGDCYGKWDTAFAAFCLHYAQIPEEAFPIEKEIEPWQKALQEAGVYMAADEAEPAVGDLVFLQKQEQETEKQVGIVSKVEERDGERYIHVIEGNCENQVKENEYDICKTDILGYASLHETQNQYQEKKVQNQAQILSSVSGMQSDQPAAETNTAETINERLAVELTAGRSGTTAQTGETLYAKVVSRYSKANNPKENVGVVIKIGKLPEGVSIAGFSNGTKEVVFKDEQNKEHTILLQIVEENGMSYIKFEQPAGATVEFEVQFNSSNGIMENGASVTLEVDKEKITGLDTPIGDNDLISGPLTLIWNGQNVWDPVDKKVNGADYNEIAVTRENKLSGTLNYTIEANSANREAFGEIWTDYILVTDVLTLPSDISFPEGTRVNSRHTAIVDGSGKELFYVSKMQQGAEITNLTLNGNSVSYTIKVPNNQKENGIPSGEQENLSLEMKLDAERLVLSKGFSEKSAAELKRQVIENKTFIQPVPYQPYGVKGTEDTVTTVPAAVPEDFVVEKEADKKQVQAGDTVTYTLSVKNTGNSAIKVKDDSGAYYKVTDRLPVYLYLTESQINALPTDVTYDAGSHTVSWIPSRTNIPAGAECNISFSTTVKEATDEAMKQLSNGAVIKNVAQYKGKYSNGANVTYQKAEIKITKTSEDEGKDGEVSNGERITYTLQISNNTDLNAVMDEVITDTLPKGLIFESAVIGMNHNIKESGTYILHYATSSEAQDHMVAFTVDGQNLAWNVGVVHAHETIELSYKCRVDVDKLDSKTQILNTASGSSGGSDSDSVPVDYPIELEKKVEQDTSVIYPDKAIFDYTVSIRNDKEHPSEKDDLELSDQLPIGMLPVDCKLIQHQTSGGTTVEKEISWEDFWEDKFDKNAGTEFTAEIGGRKARIEKNWNGIRIIWNIGKMRPGEEIKFTYRAQITLSEEQKAEGGQYGFTNMAYADGISKSVTVYGGQAVGQLYLEKDFDGNKWWDVKSLTEDQKKITFELTGVDAEGKAIIFSDGTQKQTITLAEFNNITNSGCCSHIFKNLPVGIYTVTETNAEVEGKVLTTTYRVDANHTVEGETNQAVVRSQEQTQIVVDNTYGTGAAVDIQKSVWALKRESVQKEKTVWSDIPDKKLFAIDTENDTDKNLVIYNMTVVNTGSESVHVDTLQDELPEELTYVGICSNSWGMWNQEKAFTQEITSQSYGGLNQYDGNQLAAGVKITTEVNEKKNQVTCLFEKASGGYELESGKAITFLMLCKVNEHAVEGKPVINTIKLPVDEEVGYKDYEEIKTVHTPYDKNQNNGTSKDEGVENHKRTISSSVTILPENTMVPGISKNAVSYIVPGKTEEHPLNGDSNIQPDSTVKWEITLYNDGTKDLTNYQVEDAVTTSFHLMTPKEAQEKEISVPYRLEIFSYDEKSQGVFDISGEVWKTITTGSAESKYTFDFSGEKYSIPAGGYATLTLYTNNTIGNYKVYKNTATLLPDGSFDANQVKHGELKKDTDGRYIGVTASDEVNALGDYASVSWKTVIEKGNESNTARGTQEKNYISVGLDSEYVTYTNNIRNVSGKDFSRFVVIDLMPSNNDTGVINQNDVRGSEFTIPFTEGLEVFILKNGEKIPVKGYSIEFSKKKSFSQEDFDGSKESGWHEKWQGGDCSFRVKLPESFALEPLQTLVVQYDGKLGADAKPGAIAWNSFGYQYYSGSHSTPMKAEPPKVGVLIPKVPIVQKEVVDSTGKVQDYDANKVFTFELAEKGNPGNKKLCEFTICQGGYMELSGLKDKDGNRVALENGKEYVITEIKDRMPEDYELIGIGEKGNILKENYTFTYYENKDITILAKNQVDTYQFELPKTGGTGIIVYTAGGALLMLASSVWYGYRMRHRRERRTK